jgi:hypothetical protein
MTDFLRAQGHPTRPSATSGIFPWAYAWGGWPQAMETSLISSLERPAGCRDGLHDPTTSIGFDTVMNKPTCFLGPDWEPLWFTSDPHGQRLFIFPSVGYTVIIFDHTRQHRKEVRAR